MVAASSFPPAFHNSSVISVNLEARNWVGLGGLDDAKDEELESNGFGPTNVTAVSFPSWYEAPGTPPSINPNCDAHA
jgi:hypothetical protein